ncbi:hypothetical protein L7F22_004986 [Adiantum nelumboides]|nr:hypothetical protein [Adiantum nelumboides]
MEDLDGAADYLSDRREEEEVEELDIFLRLVAVAVIQHTIVTRRRLVFDPLGSARAGSRIQPGGLQALVETAQKAEKRFRVSHGKASKRSSKDKRKSRAEEIGSKRVTVSVLEVSVEFSRMALVEFSHGIGIRNSGHGLAVRVRTAELEIQTEECWGNVMGEKCFEKLNNGNNHFQDIITPSVDVITERTRHEGKQVTGMQEFVFEPMTHTQSMKVAMEELLQSQQIDESVEVESDDSDSKSYQGSGDIAVAAFDPNEEETQVWLKHVGLYEFACLPWQSWAANEFAEQQWLMLKEGDSFIAGNVRLTPKLVSKVFKLPYLSVPAKGTDRVWESDWGQVLLHGEEYRWNPSCKSILVFGKSMHPTEDGIYVEGGFCISVSSGAQSKGGLGNSLIRSDAADREKGSSSDTNGGSSHFLACVESYSNSVRNGKGILARPRHVRSIGSGFLCGCFEARSIGICPGLWNRATKLWREHMALSTDQFKNWFLCAGEKSVKRENEALKAENQRLIADLQEMRTNRQEIEDNLSKLKAEISSGPVESDRNLAAEVELDVEKQVDLDICALYKFLHNNIIP